jgi:hypothetical protein
VKLQASLERNVYAMGSEAALHVKVNNHSDRRIIGLEVALEQQLKITLTDEEKVCGLESV